MTTEFAVTIGVIGISALILHFKSHIKFIAIGLLIGLLLVDVAIPILLEEVALGGNALMGVNLAALLLPAAVLGLNHTVDKHKLGFINTILHVAVGTLFLIASVLIVLPTAMVDSLTDKSILIFQIHYYRTWILLAAVLLILADSFRHKKKMVAMKEKKKKKGKK